MNRALVEKYFGQEDPLGRQLTLKHLATLPQQKVEDPTFEIIGVVTDAKNQGLQDPVQPEAIIPDGITGAFERGILVHTAGPPMAMLNDVRREIWAVDLVQQAGQEARECERSQHAERRGGEGGPLNPVSPGFFLTLRV